MQITTELVQEAYLKLKSYFYHDTTELYNRRRLAIFETDLGEDNFIYGNSMKPYIKREDVFKVKIAKTEEKFEQLSEWINGYLTNNKPLERFLDDINLLSVPKKYTKSDDKTFISNQKIQLSYEIERVTVFIDPPTEVQLISVLWLMQFGHRLDKELGECCVGNRLLLNQDKTDIIKGSGLFKPYFKQYQKWRDEAVKAARNKIESDKNVAFLNLDLKDYFYSVELDFKNIENLIWGKDKYNNDSPLHELFKDIHKSFMKKLFEKKYPYPDFENRIGDNYILPIGLLSSYVIANWYLREFDKRIEALIPNVYYSRYVDDIILVIENPDFDFHDKENCESVKFDFKKYTNEEKKKGEKISFSLAELKKTEKYLLETLYPIVKLIDLPTYLRKNDNKDKIERVFKITCIEGGYFQSDKTLLYFFDHNESTVAIDKLKKEMEERASEFRDFPEDEMGDESFEEQAYHLIYDGTEGKIRTLKDYKENRYGLSVFLANRIFAALRRRKKVDYSESQKLIKLFKGLNNLEYFRLWEKIFTFFIVNNDSDGFVEFYKQTFTEIQKLDNARKVQDTEINGNDISRAMLSYFEIAVEMAIALNPQFLKKGSKAHKGLEIFQSKNQWHVNWIKNADFTTTQSYYITRFRRSNLIRHHYVAHPLLNYTIAARKNQLNLVDNSLPSLLKYSAKELEFSTYSVSFSPRIVKYWECCIAKANYFVLTQTTKQKTKTDERYWYTKMMSFSKKNNSLLDEAYSLFEVINKPHLPKKIFNSDDFFKRKFKNIDINVGHPPVNVSEFRVDAESKFQNNPVISVANLQVHLGNIEASVKGKPILSHDRYQVFTKLLKESRLSKADIFILPEFSVPYEFVPSLAKYAAKNKIAIIAGLEHWTVDDLAYNFIVTILPLRVDGIDDAIVLYRLKNHYAHIEELIIRGFGLKVPKPNTYEYHLLNWKNLYFTSFYCFELADTFHRSIFRSAIDLLIASEWNKDTPYFSNIVEALSRDLHCFIAQVNTSQFGDSRLTQPSETARKDILKLKGGRNDTILVDEIDISKLRDFQLKSFERTKSDKDDSFKPLPPDWNRKLVNKRINNENIF